MTGVESSSFQRRLESRRIRMAVHLCGKDGQGCAPRFSRHAKRPALWASHNDLMLWFFSLLERQELDVIFHILWIEDLRKQGKVSDRLADSYFELMSVDQSSELTSCP